MIKIFISIFALSTSAFAQGGGSHAGNGGDAVVCRDRSGKVTSIESLDRYEAKAMRGLTPVWDGSRPDTVESLLGQLLERLSLHSPVRADLYKKWSESFAKEANFLRGVTLVDIPDSEHLGFPSGCGVEQLIIQQVPRFAEDYRFQINADLWDLLSNQDRAIMIQHEMILREMMGARSAAPDCTEDLCPIQTRGLRYLGSLVFSDRIKNLGVTEFLWIIQEVTWLQFREHPILSEPAPVKYWLDAEGPQTSVGIVVRSRDAAGPLLLNSSADFNNLKWKFPIPVGRVHAGGTQVVVVSGGYEIRFFDGETLREYRPLRTGISYSQSDFFHLSSAKNYDEGKSFFWDGANRLELREASVMPNDLMTGTIWKIKGSRTKVLSLSFQWDFNTRKVSNLRSDADQEIIFSRKDSDIQWVISAKTGEKISLNADGFPTELEKFALKVVYESSYAFFSGRLTGDLRVVRGEQTARGITIPLQIGSLFDSSEEQVVLGEARVLRRVKKYRRINSSNSYPVWGPCTRYDAGNILNLTASREWEICQ